MSQWCGIQVCFQYLVLGKPSFQLQGIIHFNYFSFPFFFGIKVYILDKLLCDSTGALRQIPALQVGFYGTKNTVEVYAFMFHKSFIFNSYKGISQIQGYLVYSNHGTVLIGMQSINNLIILINNICSLIQVKQFIHIKRPCSFYPGICSTQRNAAAHKNYHQKKKYDKP